MDKSFAKGLVNGIGISLIFWAITVFFIWA
jgi:hypothetical protein